MIDKTVNNLLTAYQEDGGVHIVHGVVLPDGASIKAIIEQLLDILFPGFKNPIPDEPAALKAHITAHCTSIREKLNQALFRALFYRDHETQSEVDIQQKATQILAQFLDHIIELRRALLEDASAIFSMDPAAKNEPEIMLAYPGFKAISVYRIAHFFDQHNIPLIPRMMTESVHSETGIDIHPSAQIGSHFSIDHGTGVVIGETSIIGNHVKLYQGVTIGALSVSKSDSQTKRHPTIEDHVTIYARTTLLGGKTVIGEHSIIGGNMWIVQSIPAHSKVYNQAIPHVSKRTANDD